MAPSAVTLTCLLDEYHGHDFAHPDNPPIDVVAGDVVDVTAEKAEQLLGDFPDGFEAEDPKAAEKAAKEAEAKRAAAEKAAAAEQAAKDKAAAAAAAAEAKAIADAAAAAKPATPAKKPAAKPAAKPRRTRKAS